MTDSPFSNEPQEHVLIVPPKPTHSADAKDMSNQDFLTCFRLFGKLTFHIAEGSDDWQAAEHAGLLQLFKKDASD